MGKGSSTSTIAVILSLCLAIGLLMGLSAQLGNDFSPLQAHTIRIAAALLLGLVAATVTAFLSFEDARVSVALRTTIMAIVTVGTFFFLPYVDESFAASATRELRALGAADDAFSAAASAQQTGNDEEATRLYEDAAHQYAMAQLPEATAESLLHAAKTALANENLDAAERAYHAVLELPQSDSRPLAGSAANVGLARVLLKRAEPNLDDAERCLTQARHLADSSKDARAGAAVSLALGELRLRQERWGDARELLAGAESVFVAHGDTAAAAQTALALGDAERGAGRLKPAEAAFTRAAGAFNKGNDPLGEGNARRRLGATLRATSLFTEARREYQSALKSYQMAGSSSGTALARKDLESLTPPPRLSATHTRAPSRNGRPYFDFVVQARWSDADASLVKSVYFDFMHPSLTNADGLGKRVNNVFSIAYRGWGCTNLKVKVTYSDQTKKSYQVDLCGLLAGGDATSEQQFPAEHVTR